MHVHTNMQEQIEQAISNIIAKMPDPIATANVTLSTIEGRKKNMVLIIAGYVHCSNLLQKRTVL